MSTNRITSLSGVWTLTAKNGKTGDMKIPGTLDESNIGYIDAGNAEAAEDSEREFAEDAENREEPDEDTVILTRFTRKYTYTGAVRISRMLTYQETPGKRLFLEVERARVLSLYIDGIEVPYYNLPSLSTPHIFEVTGLLNGNHMITLISDNSYPGLPKEELMCSAAANDDSQTNWNGLLGYVRLREEEEVFAERVIVRPQKDGTLSIYIEISSMQEGTETVKISSPVLRHDYEQEFTLNKAYQGFVAGGLTIRDDVDIEKWDEGEGKLQEFTVTIRGQEKTVRFGLRNFGTDAEGYLVLNGRRIFLRGETSLAVHPETGYLPMDTARWTAILKRYREYGVNFVRFSSHCPPDAAFTAADELGMFLMPELSLKKPAGGLMTEEGMEYYLSELIQILRTYGNHPSFMMLSLGSELSPDESGTAFYEKMLKTAKAVDDTRLYTVSSDTSLTGTALFADNDFLLTASYGNSALRGTFAAVSRVAGMQGDLNNEYPDERTDYQDAVSALRHLRKIPVISLEAGQYETLPDFHEIDLFYGFLSPDNLRFMRKAAEDLNLLKNWDHYVEASGELAKRCYRMEIERALRTESLSGITLKSLQDYPGEGLAAVGMMNSHLQPKPYPFSDPKSFRAFFNEALPLLLLERYTYNYGDVLTAEAKFANYGRTPVTGVPEYQIRGGDFLVKGSFGEEVTAVPGKLTRLGTLSIPLEGEGIDLKKACKLTITVKLAKNENSWQIWVYPLELPLCPEDIYETQILDYNVWRVLEEGGKVFLTPPATREALPISVRTQFSTNFWSVYEHSRQNGTMGQYIDAAHPVFSNFPTEAWTDLQWWPMANSRAVILPRDVKSLVTVMDSTYYLRPLSQLFEFRAGRGSILFSSMGLKEKLIYPEVRALLSGIYNYMASYDFSPSGELRTEELKKLMITATGTQ